MTNFKTAMLSFLQDAQNEFNSEKKVDHFIEKHAPKLMEAARKRLQTEAEIAKRRRHDQFIASQNYRKSVDYIHNVLGWNNDDGTGE